MKNSTVRKIEIDAYLAEAKEFFGEKARYWVYICPQCRTRQTLQDFIDVGIDFEIAEKRIGFSCIGRVSKDTGCNYSLGGLIQLHAVEVISNGEKFPRFEFDFSVSPHYPQLKNNENKTN